MYSLFSDFDKDYGFTEKCGFQLKDLQIKDIETFVLWKASGNFYEVGGGKTVVSTAVALMRDADLVVVTVPPILTTSWVRWLKTAASSVVAYVGSPAQRANLNLSEFKWLVVSHAIFRKDFDRLAALVQSRERPELIVDEAHHIKNVQSILYKKVKTLAPLVNLQLLTGTPISKPTDTYAYISLKTPTSYRNYVQFMTIHVSHVGVFGKPIGHAHLDMLKERFKEKTISRTKSEIHDYDLKPLFPDTTYELSLAHYKLYQRLVDERLLSFDNGAKIDATTTSALRHALQQVIVNFDYFSQEPKNRSAAYDIIDQTIEETNCTSQSASKLIIWSKYKRTTASVLDYCTKLGIKTVAAYSGANSSASAEAFMHDPSVRILVANPQSAGAGLNPQYVCNEALFLEMDTVPIYNRQSIGRLDRAGQTKTPRMRIAVAANTVQVGLFKDLLRNDDMVQRIESTKDSLRQMLLGQV